MGPKVKRSEWQGRRYEIVEPRIRYGEYGEQYFLTKIPPTLLNRNFYLKKFGTLALGMN